MVKLINAIFKPDAFITGYSMFIRFCCSKKKNSDIGDDDSIFAAFRHFFLACNQVIFPYKPIRKKCTLGPIHSSSVWRNKSLTLTQTLTLIHRAIEAHVGPKVHFIQIVLFLQ